MWLEMTFNSTISLHCQWAAQLDATIAWPLKSVGQVGKHLFRQMGLSVLSESGFNAGVAANTVMLFGLLVAIMCLNGKGASLNLHHPKWHTWLL